MKRFFLLLITSCSSVFMSHADEAMPDKLSTIFNYSNWQVGGKFGTLGVGLELSAPVASKHHARVNLNAMNYNISVEDKSINYDADVDLLSFGVLYDFYPYNRNLRLTTGLYYNGNEIALSNDSSNAALGRYILGGVPYDLTGSKLTGQIEFNPVAPYVGIGYGSSVLGHKQWTFSVDLGILYQGEPDVELSASGPVTADATLAANLEKEEQELKDELSNLPFYPVVSFGIAYRF